MPRAATKKGKANLTTKAAKSTKFIVKNIRTPSCPSCRYG
jgi:hypothetical protein